jgi:dipeptidyl aminopeptidase/acylaminoacyl peptidase
MGTIKTIGITLFMLFMLNIAAQNTQTLKEIYGMNPISLSKPIEIDSVNIKGEKFDDKNLLKTQITIPEQSAFVNLMKSDSDDFFIPEKSEAEYSLQLFSFYVSSDRYAKGTIKVTSPNMLEIYVDDILATSKTTKEDSISTDKNVKTSITPYPVEKRIVVKLFASANDKIAPTFKIELENEKEDPITNFVISNSDMRKINFTDMLVGNRISNVSVSPKGTHVLIWYRNSAGEKSSTITELYNIKKNTRMVIDLNGSKHQLNWMPSSDKLYYVRNLDNNSEIVAINPLSFEETVLAENIPSEINVMFSCDEKTIYYSKQEKSEESKNDLKLLKSVEDRQTGYSNRSSIYKYDLTTGLNQQLTFGTNSSWISDISNDSKKMLISFSEENITERPFQKRSMLLLDLTNMQVDTLWFKENFIGRAIFSPDAKKILISGSGEAFDGIGLNIDESQIANTYHTLAFIMDLETKNVEAITKDFDPSIDNFFWNSKDNLIYMITTDEDFVNVYTYNPSSKTYNKLPLKEEVIRTFKIGKNSSTGVYMGLGQANTTRAYLYDLQSQKSTLIADPYNETLSKLKLSKINDWNFVNSDGIEIKGKYYLPPDFDASRKYPLIVYYYGGTMPTSRTFESPYPGHVFAAQDYIVYIVQPSGATGFGQKFAAMHVNAWGKRTAEDIIEGTIEFISAHSYVDKDKVGCIGASYGGFMTMYLLTQTDIFAAGVSHAGISSISSYWGEGYWGYSYSSGASAHSYPWNNHELYVKQSPLFNADKINTPLLLTHGTVDTNVPIGESIQMYTALKILGKPVEFIQVKDENHGIMKYKRRVEWNNSIMAWFAKWLKNDSGWWDSMYPQN